MNVTFVQPCPPHEWAHAPTVGYFACGKCRARVDHSDPEYNQMLLERAQTALSEKELHISDAELSVTSSIADEIVLAVCELPDRTSPEDWPEALLVTTDELHAIVIAVLNK